MILRNIKGKTQDAIFDKLKAGNINTAAKVLEAIYTSWVKYTAKDRRMKICIVTAQSRWRSRIEIAPIEI